MNKEHIKIPTFPFMILIGMSIFWVAFFWIYTYIFKTFVSYLHVKKEKRCCLLHTSPNINILWWLVYFITDLITGSLMLLEMELQLVYSAIIRFITILEKKVFRICAILKSLSVISSIWFKVTFCFDVISSDKNDLMIFQELSISLTIFKSESL